MKTLYRLYPIMALLAIIITGFINIGTGITIVGVVILTLILYNIKSLKLEPRWLKVEPPPTQPPVVDEKLAKKKGK